MGRIARAVATRAVHGFGMQIIFHDPFPPDAKDIEGLNATQCSSLEQVFAKADFISLHCPGGKETYHLIGAEAFRAMKPTAFLINSARGDVIDDPAILRQFGGVCRDGRKCEINGGDQTGHSPQMQCSHGPLLF